MKVFVYQIFKKSEGIESSGIDRVLPNKNIDIIDIRYLDHVAHGLAYERMEICVRNPFTLAFEAVYKPNDVLFINEV